MIHIWTWSGNYFGYHENNELWTADGKHVGKIYDNIIYDMHGNYIGEIKSGRLICKAYNRFNKKSSFSSFANSMPVVKYADYIGYVTSVGYEDLSM